MVNATVSRPFELNDEPNTKSFDGFLQKAFLPDFSAKHGRNEVQSAVMAGQIKTL
jgi:hypothetical protein